MASFNKVILMGNLTRDPELRHTPKGMAVADIALAVNETYRSGETLKEEVVYVDIVVWGRLAETCKEYLTKGSPVLVEGRLQLDQWESEGKKVSKLRVRADVVRFLSRGRVDGQRGERPASNHTRQTEPMMGSEKHSSRSGPPLNEMSEVDDDIPF